MALDVSKLGRKDKDLRNDWTNNNKNVFNIDRDSKANSVSENTFDNTTTAKPRHNMLSTIAEE